jgi:zinc/manganese transport system permease protein
MDILIIPFCVCVILVIMHVYFGSIVLKRGILFIDLALAQWAALGYLVALVFHIEKPLVLFGFGFLSTVFAALVLTIISRLYKSYELQEAVIGVMYVAATAASVGLISFTGMEPHHISSMLSGHLLFVSGSECLFAFILYAGVGISLLYFHRVFMQSESSFSQFMFYVLFGLVVTSSVKLVGVLLVFSFLVLPLLTVVLHIKCYHWQVISAWGVGLFSSLLGLYMSFSVDIPPSYLVILMLIGVWLVSTFIKSALNLKHS